MQTKESYEHSISLKSDSDTLSCDTDEQDEYNQICMEEKQHIKEESYYDILMEKIEEEMDHYQTLHKCDIKECLLYIYHKYSDSLIFDDIVYLLDQIGFKIGEYMETSSEEYQESSSSSHHTDTEDELMEQYSD